MQLFVNTLDSENGIEELIDDDALRRTLMDAGLLGAWAEVEPGDLERAIEVREGLRALLLANNDVPAGPEELAPLEQAARAARFSLAVGGDGALRLVPTAGGVDGALGRLLAVVHEAALDGSLRRLKACRRDICHWIFYDRSRNGSSMWCATSVCGNRTNTKAYRGRKAGVLS